MNETIIKLVLFASGEGTNAQAIIDYVEEEPRVKVVGLISDKKDANVLKRATAKSIPAYYIAHEDAASRTGLLKELAPDWALLAGYMRIFDQEFLQFFRDNEQQFNRVLNIHPSLLPAFPGLHAQKQAYRAGVKVSGVTIHLVDEKVDHGLPVLQSVFERNDRDSFDDFCRRGQLLEHETYCRAVSLIADNRISVEKQKDFNVNYIVTKPID